MSKQNKYLENVFKTKANMSLNYKSNKTLKEVK